MNSGGRSVFYRAFQITEQEAFPLGWGGVWEREVGDGRVKRTLTELLTV